MGLVEHFRFVGDTCEFCIKGCGVQLVGVDSLHSNSMSGLNMGNGTRGSKMTLSKM